jgi:hypothetical protein
MAFLLVPFSMQAHTEKEIADLHEKHNQSIEKLTMDLLYDREWCREQGIDYCDIKSEDFKTAENFVVNSIFNPAYQKNGQS